MVKKILHYRGRWPLAAVRRTWQADRKRKVHGRSQLGQFTEPAERRIHDNTLAIRLPPWNIFTSSGLNAPSEAVWLSENRDGTLFVSHRGVEDMTRHIKTCRFLKVSVMFLLSLTNTRVKDKNKHYTHWVTLYTQPAAGLGHCQSNSFIKAVDIHTSARKHGFILKLGDYLTSGGEM